MFQNILHEAIDLVCPIYGISIGNQEDKTTWAIRFKDGATDSEKIAAQIVIDNFEYINLEQVNAAKEQLILNDIVSTRCFKAGIEYPQEWKDFDIALRVIIQNGKGELPQRPSYPLGT